MWRTSTSDVTLTLISIEQWEILACNSVHPKGHLLKGCVTFTPICRIFRSLTITTWFNDLGLSIPVGVWTPPLLYSMFFKIVNGHPRLLEWKTISKYMIIDYISHEKDQECNIRWQSTVVWIYWLVVKLKIPSSYKNTLICTDIYMKWMSMRWLILN